MDTQNILVEDYLKTKNMKKQLHLLLLLVFANISFTSISQEKDKKSKRDPEVMEVDSVFGFFLMVNSEDTTKQFKLRDAGAYTLIYSEKVNDTITQERIVFANGNIRDLYDKTLDFDIRNETIEHNFKDGSYMNIQNDYSSFYYSEHEKPRSIDLKSLHYIDYSSPTRSVVHAVGVSSMIIGGAIALVAAPLLNINFKQGGISSTGYMNTVKVGAIGFAFGFPISYFSRTKRYQLTSNKSLKDEDYWYIDKQK